MVPGSEAWALGDFSNAGQNRTAFSVVSREVAQGSESCRSTLDLESVLTVGIDVPVEGRRQMAEIDVAADPLPRPAAVRWRRSCRRCSR